MQVSNKPRPPSRHQDAVPMNTTSHKDATPRPWVHEIDGDCHMIINTLGHDVAWVEGIFNKFDEKKNAANAALIVQAVNAHDELVEALKRAKQFIRNGIDLGAIAMPDPETPDSAHATLPFIDAALAKVQS